MMKTSILKSLIFLALIFMIKSEDLPIGSKCESHDGSEGSCVVAKNCASIVEKLRNHLIGMNQIKICNHANRYVCCPAETSTNKNTVPKKPDVSQNDSLFSSRTSSQFSLINNGSTVCGKPLMGFGTVYYGTQIKRGAFPWNVALTKADDGKFFCGGSLISKNLVVTAAHCIEGKHRSHIFGNRDIYVIIGAHNLEARREYGAIIASVKDIHIHHEWNPHITSYDADIAIIELANDVTFNEYIQPICIAAPKSEAALKTEGVVVGFGKSEYSTTENIARVISSPIHTYEFCTKSTDHENLLTHRGFCGGYANGTSVCQGDSGSGLIVKHEEVYYLRGIVSASLYDTLIGCNIHSYSIYTDVLEFYSWITTGQDDKILLQNFLEENKVLKSKVISLTKNLQDQEYLVKKLKEEIRLLKSGHIPEINRPSIPKGGVCQSEDGTEGICTDLNSCGTLKNKTNSLNDQPTICNNQMNYICCTPEKQRISARKCKEYEKITQKNIINQNSQLANKTTIRDDCQHRFIPLIFGGIKANKYEFPHQALVGYNKGTQQDNIEWYCGGSLISSSFVLTAASCTRQRFDLFVKLGMIKESQKDEEVFVYGVDIKILHPAYDRRTNNDIALLKLNNTVNFTKYIYPICLPLKQPETHKTVATGFGKTEAFGSSSDHLLKVSLERFSHNECQSAFEDIKIDSTSMLCYGHRNGGKDTCAGDSGGPLQVSNDEEAKCTYKQIGIISYGIAFCGSPGIPGIYTNVFNYLDWIEEIVWEGEI